MAFTFTVNGVTYTETDFASNNYAPNFLRLLADCTDHLTKSMVTRGSTIGSGSSSPTTLNCEPGKLFYPGMPVTAFCNGTSSTYIATVLTYSKISGIMTLSIHRILGDTVGVERSDWTISLGGSEYYWGATGPYTGGTAIPVTDTATLKSLMEVGYPDVRLEPHFEDFCGYFPTVTSSSSTSTLISTAIGGIAVNLTGQAEFSVDGNQLEAFADSRCPGVAKLTCKTVGDTLALVSKGSAKHFDNFRALFRVFIPITEGVSFELAMGVGSETFSSLKESPGAFIAYNYLRGSEGAFKPIEGVYNSAEGVSGTVQVISSSISQNWKEGRWLSIEVTKTDVNSAKALVYDDTNSLVETIYLDSFPGTDGDPFQECFPFIFMRKLSGSKPSVVYLDYIGSSCVQTGESFR